MAELDPAHVNAVGELLDDLALMRCGRSLGILASSDIATDLLTSTDPVVHAALLAALVRADYLRRARELAEVASELATASGCSPQDALETMVRALTEVVEHAHD